MRTIRSRFTLQHGLAWLLWVALLIPMAQSATAWHVLSHAAADADADTDDQRRLPNAAHCDLCSSAATVTGGALPAAPLTVALAAARDRPPAPAARSGWIAATTAPYRSRAPPASH